jgi:DNA repair protein SbcC/Rad50
LIIENERSRLTQERTTLLGEASQVESVRAQLPALKKQLEKTHQAAAALQARLEQRAALEAEIRTAGDSAAALASENDHLRTEMRELDERINRLKETSGATCPLCGQPLDAKDRERLIAELEAQGHEKGDRYRQNLADTQAMAQRRKELETSLAGFARLENDLRETTRTADQLETQLKLQENLLEGWKVDGQARLDELTRLLESETYAQAARTDLARIDAQLKVLGYDPAAHRTAREVEMAGRASEETHHSLGSARGRLEPLEREINGLEEQLKQAESEVEAQQSAWQQADGTYQQAAATLPDLQETENEVYRLREEENRLRVEMGQAQQRVSVLATQRTRRSDLSAHLNELVRRIAQYKELERAFGKDGLPALLIEQALPEIEAEANQILDRLSDGNMSVRFATQREYKDKSRDDRRETLDIFISDPAGEREYELFSGGEAFRVNFAIRLALSRVLSQRAGARLQTLVIDEGFGSQDSEGRQRLIEAINMVRPDFARILVITHLEELKDAFPSRIEVEKTPTGSQVRVVTP